MKRDIKYIIKRILIGVAIALILANINKCSVFADEKKALYICGTTQNDICYGTRSDQNQFINLPTLDTYFAYYTGPYYGSTIALYNYDREYFHIINTDYWSSNQNYNYFLFVNFEYGNDIYVSSRYGSSSNNLSILAPRDIFITDKPETADYLFNNSFIHTNSNSNTEEEFLRQTITINNKEIYIIYSPYGNYRNYYNTDIVNTISNSLYYTYGTTGGDITVQFQDLQGNKETFEREDFIFDLTDYFKEMTDTGGDDWVDNTYTSPTGTGLKKLQGYISLLKIPINLLLKIMEQISTNHCTAISIPIPFVGSYVNLPCLSSVFQNVLGVGAYTFFKGITNFTYAIVFTISNVVFFMKAISPYLSEGADIVVGGSL